MQLIRISECYKFFILKIYFYDVVLRNAAIEQMSLKQRGNQIRLAASANTRHNLDKAVVHTLYQRRQV